MKTMPTSERHRFETLILRQSERYGLTPDEYLRKIWYHEEAAKMGEYMAMSLLDELLPFLPINESQQEAVQYRKPFRNKLN